MKLTSFRVITYALIIASCFLNSCKKNEDFDLSEFNIDPPALAGDEVKEWQFIEIKANMYAYHANADSAIYDTTLYWKSDQVKDMKFWFYRNRKLVTTPHVTSLLSINTETTWEILIDGQNYLTHYIRMDKPKWRLLRHISKTKDHGAQLLLTATYVFPSNDKAVFIIMLEEQ